MGKTAGIHAPSFEHATRDWIIEQVGLSGFYEINRMKSLEREGHSIASEGAPVEMAAILAMLRENNGTYFIPPKNRKQCELHLYNQKKMGELKMEGEMTIGLAEGLSRITRYTKLFKVFRDSHPLSEFDGHVFSSLYDRIKHAYGGRMGSMFFYKLEGTTSKGHAIAAYIFSDKGAENWEDAASAIADASLPKRIFVTENGRMNEKDPLLASSGMLTPKTAKITHRGAVFSH